MDFGDIIYVVFVIISVLFGVFGKKKKKAPNTPPSGFDLEQLLKNVYETSNSDLTEEYAHTEKVPDSEPEIIPEQEKSTFAEELKKKKEQSKARVNKVKSQSKNSPIFENEISDTVPSSELDFDAKKAVIYSEILKRPNY